MAIRLENRLRGRGKTNQLTRIIEFLKKDGSCNYTEICKRCFESHGTSEIRNSVDWLVANGIVILKITSSGSKRYTLNPEFVKLKEGVKRNG